MTLIPLIRGIKRVRPFVGRSDERSALTNIHVLTSQRAFVAVSHYCRSNHLQRGLVHLAGGGNLLSSINKPVRFQSNQEAEPSLQLAPLLFEEILPHKLDKIYASPHNLLAQNGKNPVFYETNSISIDLNDKETVWYTSTATQVTKKYGSINFHSGKFGDLMKKLSTDELFFETMVVDGKVYYTTEEHAKEAAAARVVDSSALRAKYRTKKYLYEPVEPIRYCVEMPILGDSWLAAMSPQYNLICRMQQKYGPVEVEYHVKSEQFQSPDGAQEWFSATCIDPISGEGFQSGVFATNGSISMRPVPNAPTSPLGLEEIRVQNNRVFYKDEENAKHAAAARALDCLDFRDGHDTAFLPQYGRLCIEEPFMKDDENPHSIDYEKVLKIVTERRLDPHSELMFGRLIEFTTKQPWMLHLPRKLIGDVENDFRTGHRKPLEYELLHRDFSGESWYTSSVTVSTTEAGEKFYSGLIGQEIDVEKGTDFLQTPLHLAPVTVADGRVYYRTEQLATNAAAARAIDCILFRGDRHRVVHLGTEPIFQLCMEDPYNNPNKVTLQQIDYEALLTKRGAPGELEPDRSPAILDDSVASFLDENPYKLHVPLNCLSQIFERHFGHRTLVYDSGYGSLCKVNDEVITINGNEWYTSSVVAPNTGEEFYSGLIGREVNVEKKAGNTLRTPLHKAVVQVIHGRVYYKQPNVAQHAAAARAIDCLIFRRANRQFIYDDLSKIQLCMEDPYFSPSERDSQQLDYDQLLSERLSLGSSEMADASIDHVALDNALADRFQKVVHHLHVPASFLSKITDQLCTHPTYSSSTIIENGRAWYSSTVEAFLGEEFHSGLIGHEANVEKRAVNTLKTPLHEAEVKIIGGRVYYSVSKLADHAAAARAIDCYIFRRASRLHNHDGLSSIQLCMEDPYLSSDERDSQEIDYNHLLTLRAGGNVNDTTVGEDTGGLTPDKQQEIGQSSKLSTMGRIAEIWTNQHTANLETPEFVIEEEPPETRLENIMAWYKRTNKSPRSYDDAVALSNLCKRVLEVLAESTNYKNGSFVSCSGDKISVAMEGRDIWNNLCALQSKFNASLLDTDTCNNYICCLDSSDAALAEDLLSAMAKEKAFGELNLMLPNPNVDTYNAVMSLWSKTNQLDAADGVNRVYQSLEDAYYAGESKSNLQPNNNTFKILIAVNSKRNDGTFSFQKAKSCLDKMEKMAQSCTSLHPNSLEIYNAALSKRRASHHDYKPSWLWNGRAFEHGFVDATQSSNVEGMDIEEWCVLMEKNEVTGDIETFEAGIQAWVDTGTLEGLLRAEEWMKRVLIMTANGSDQNLTPRYETFQPIIAAWALCGNVRSRGRVAEWIDQLTALSKAMPHLPYLSPDVNTFAAKIIATRRYQTSLVENFSDVTVDASLSDQKQEYARDDLELVFELAKNCTNLLSKDLMSDMSNFAGLIDTDWCAPIFVNCINAWGDAARLARQAGVDELTMNTSLGVREMINVSRLFESKLKKSLVNDEDCSTPNLDCLGDIYSAVARQLIQLDTFLGNMANESETHSSTVGEQIAGMERMLRNYEHYSRQLNGFSNKEMTVKRLVFYQDILRGCKGVSSSADYGHVIRICNVIMDYMIHSKDKRKPDFIAGGHNITDLFVEIVAISCKCVAHPRERKLVLTKVFENASPFFDVTDKKKFGAVDKASLIGAIRVGLVNMDDEGVESFITSLEERNVKQRRWD